MQNDNYFIINNLYGLFATKNNTPNADRVFRSELFRYYNFVSNSEQIRYYGAEVFMYLLYSIFDEEC